MTVSGRALAIIGYGGHGRVVADIARAMGVKDISFIDDDPAKTAKGVLVSSPVSEIVPRWIASHVFVSGIGDARARRRNAEFVLSRGGQLATLVHPSAIVAPGVEIGIGTVVMAGAVINAGARIGRFSIINTRASVDHDDIIEDNVQVCPGATLAGNVVCREDAFIGTGATIIPRVEIGKGAYVAAGATVIRNVAAGTLVGGCPARLIRKLPE